MDNSVQGIQFLDLSGLAEGDQAALKDVLHGDPQPGKLSWGAQPYSAPVENNAVEPTVEHYAVAPLLLPLPSSPPPPPSMFLPTTYYNNGPLCHWVAPSLTDERVNGEDEHNLPVEPLAAAAVVDAKPLPPPVQEIPANDVNLIPALETHPDPGPVPGLPATVAVTGQGVSHGPPHHPQDYHPVGLPAMYGPPSMYVHNNYHMAYSYTAPMARDSSRGRRKSTGKPYDNLVYNQEAPMVMPNYLPEYSPNPNYYPVQAYYFDQSHQSSDYAYYPFMPMHPHQYVAPVSYPETGAPKGPQELKKNYPNNMQYHHSMPPKHDMSPKLSYPKVEEGKEFKAANKSLDRSKPPQGALKLSQRPDINKKAVKVESAEGSNDDKTVSNAESCHKVLASPMRGSRSSARGIPPGRYSTSRQPSQEAPPANVTSPKIFPVSPSVPAPVVPVAIPSTAVQPVAIPVPVLHSVPVPRVPVHVSAPPSLLCSAVPPESLPGAVPAVMPPPIVAAPSHLPPISNVIPVAPHGHEVEVQCVGPVMPAASVMEAQPPAAPAEVAAPPVLPAATLAKPPAPMPLAQSGAKPSQVPQSTAASTFSYAGVVGRSTPGSHPTPTKVSVSSGDKASVQVKPPFNAEDSEAKSPSAPPPKPVDKQPSQTAKPPASAVKVARRQDPGRKSMNAVVKSEPTEQAAVPAPALAALPSSNTPFPAHSTPVTSNSEATTDGTVNRAPVVTSTTTLPSRTLPQLAVSIPTPTPGNAPIQQVPLGTKASPAIASPACEGPLAQTPVSAAKQPAAVPAEASAGAPAQPAARSYAFAVSKTSSPFCSSEANSVLDSGYRQTAQGRQFSNNDSSVGKNHCSNQESDSPVWESKRNSASKPMSAPPLPSLSKDPDLFRLGDWLMKYKLNHVVSNVQPRGLSNRSNWCYIHATLQALLACPPFYNLMKHLPYTPKDCSPSESCTPIIDSIVRFINEFPRLKRPDRSARPRDENASSTAPDVPVGTPFEPTYVYKMLSAIRSDTFKVEGRQEDAEEFLSCLLNGLHDEMFELTKMVKNSESSMANGDVATNGDLSQDEGDWSEMGPKKKKTIVRRHDFGQTPLSDIFRGVLRSCVIRDQSGVQSHNVQPFFTLQLDVEKAKSVNEALDLYGTRDPLEGVTCSKTKKEVTAWQRVELEELPPVLLLHLKCFDYKVDGASKICRVVEYPIDLKVQTKSSNVKGGRSANQKMMYRLFAVVYHDGKEATKGHYITDAYHVGSNQWLRYDDSSVTVVRQELVLHARQPRVPYLLFYRRQDS